jgi:hypothetical protein
VKGVPLAWTRYLGKRFTPRPTIPWRELPPRLRVLGGATLLGWFGFMISLLTVGAIETAALKQPQQPAGIYLHPHRVKGAIRYFTNGQERIYQAAYPSMIASIAATVILVGIYSNLEERLSKRRRQAALEKFARGFEEREEP